MICTTGNQKTSIMLVLSITILAVLVTGTVANIVSATKTINVQTKRNLISTSTHVLSLAAHGNNVQTKRNQHPVTRTGSPHIVSKPLSDVTYCHYDQGASGAGPGPSADIACPTGFFSMGLTSVPPTTHTFTFSGTLAGADPSYCCPSWPFSKGTFYGIEDAPIGLGVLAKDRHFSYTFHVKTGLRQQDLEGKFSGTFHLCDNRPTGDHSFYFTAYFDRGVYKSRGIPIEFDVTSSEGSSSWGPWVAQICAAGETPFSLSQTNPR